MTQFRKKLKTKALREPRKFFKKQMVINKVQSYCISKIVAQSSNALLGTINFQTISSKFLEAILL